MPSPVRGSFFLKRLFRSRARSVVQTQQTYFQVNQLVQSGEKHHFQKLHELF